LTALVLSYQQAYVRRPAHARPPRSQYGAGARPVSTTKRRAEPLRIAIGRCDPCANVGRAAGGKSDYDAHHAGSDRFARSRCVTRPEARQRLLPDAKSTAGIFIAFPNAMSRCYQECEAVLRNHSDSARPAARPPTSNRLDLDAVPKLNCMPSAVAAWRVFGKNSETRTCRRPPADWRA